MLNFSESVPRTCVGSEHSGRNIGSTNKELLEGL